MKKDNAFTGLEAAIVLIAFVVVAAVFSYVLLGAGFFATQKAQEVTYSAIQQTTSNMFLVGQVYGNVTPTTGGDTPFLTTLNLKLGIPEGGQPQNITQLQLLFSSEKGLPSEVPVLLGQSGGACKTSLQNDVDTLQWCVVAINGNINYGNTNLYPGDRADIQIRVPTSFEITSKRDETQDYSRSFTLEVKPRVGASYLISKTLSTGFTNGPLY